MVSNICKNCNNIFESENNCKKYCTVKCREAARYLRRKDSAPAKGKAYREKNKERLKAYYESKKERRKETTLAWREANKKRVLTVGYEWRNKHREERKYHSIIQAGVYESLKKNKNPTKWLQFVDYTAEQLKTHLISTIPESYSWDDYISGELELDHILPICLYDGSTDSNDLRNCWKLKNLRLLTKFSNKSKNDNVMWDIIFQQDLIDILPEKYNSKIYKKYKVSTLAYNIFDHKEKQYHEN